MVRCIIPCESSVGRLRPALSFSPSPLAQHSPSPSSSDSLLSLSGPADPRSRQIRPGGRGLIAGGRRRWVRRRADGHLPSGEFEVRGGGSLLPRAGRLSQGPGPFNGPPSPFKGPSESVPRDGIVSRIVSESVARAVRVRVGRESRVASESVARAVSRPTRSREPETIPCQNGTRLSGLVERERARE